MNDQNEVRLAKLENLRSLGIDPYGEKFSFLDNETILDIPQIKDCQLGEKTNVFISAKGRIVLLRDMNKLVFLTVRDWTGDIQWGISKSALKSNWDIVKNIDLGDIVGGSGFLGKTKKGEPTIWIEDFTVLSKSLQPPPEKFHGLTDIEQKYRQRYVDLFSSQDSSFKFLTRSKIISFIRNFLTKRKFIEVDTPVLQPIYGGAAAKPFTTHHNKLDRDLFLRISPELYLKRCLVGGLERVYEFARCFRNEGISPRHNPEFTMLELYQAYGDYEDMMNLVEDMVSQTAEHLGIAEMAFGDNFITYRKPWKRRSYSSLFSEHVGVSIDNEDEVKELAYKNGISVFNKHYNVIVNDLFEMFVEDELINPTFVIDYPASLCPLTKRCDDSNYAQRFELYISGMEIANAYSELNDPQIQRHTMTTQLGGETDTMRILDEDFITALEFGMPPAGGLGVGIDRLCMLLTNSSNIRDVVLFPIQKN